ncbi:hypothetical protein BV898_08073 [Hypsibius exemplaris]|uniref:Uncharacterized protein n=1 Tax=Hypsibius exemplaris TaxID=2072580 RepID=A0A1W0WRE2_HYPEX|nr:hypothetical protein BV898_08073 [Hypsibius exemplaris]
MYGSRNCLIPTEPAQRTEGPEARTSPVAYHTAEMYRVMTSAGSVGSGLDNRGQSDMTHHHHQDQHHHHPRNNGLRSNSIQSKMDRDFRSERWVSEVSLRVRPRTDRPTKLFGWRIVIFRDAKVELGDGPLGRIVAGRTGS